MCKTLVGVGQKYVVDPRLDGSIFNGVGMGTSNEVDTQRSWRDVYGEYE